MRNQLNHTQAGVRSTKLTSVGEGYEDIVANAKLHSKARRSSIQFSTGNRKSAAHEMYVFLSDYFVVAMRLN